MDKISNSIKETYKRGEYVIEISETGETYEVWIYREQYGIKMLMFGLLKEDTPLAEFIKIVERNFYNYAATYHDEYED